MKKFLLPIFRFINSLIAGGIIVNCFYDWFLKSVFISLPAISFSQAIGLSTFLYLFNKIRSVDLLAAEKAEENDIVKYGGMLIPWLVLGLGFIVHLIIN